MNLAPAAIVEAPQRPPTVRRLGGDALRVAVLVVIALISWVPRSRGPIDLRWDGGVYYVLGTSLAQGGGYRLLNEPGNILAIQYPPLVSVVVAAHQKLLGTDDPAVVGVWLKLTYLAMFLLFIAASYAVLKGFMPAGWAFVGTLLCVFNFSVYFHANQCGSEVPFGIAGLALVLASRIRRGWKRETAAGAAAVAAFFTRTMGIALFAAWVLDGLLRRQFRAAAVRSLLGLACVLAWSGYVHTVESSPEYTRPAYPYQRADYLFYNVSYARNMAYKNPFRPEYGKIGAGGMLRRVVENSLVMPESLGAVVSAPRGFWLMHLIAIKNRTGLEVMRPRILQGLIAMLGMVVLAGIWILLVRRQWLIAGYILATIGAICSAPWPDQSLRYLAPVLPLLLVAFFSAVRWLPQPAPFSRLAGLRRNAPRLVIAAMLVLQFSSYGLAHTIHFLAATYRTRSGAHTNYRQLWYREEAQSLDEAIDWVASHARPGDVVASSMPQWLYVRTGLRAVMPPFETDAVKAQSLVDSVPVRYLLRERPDILQSFGWPYMDPMMRAFPGRWSLVHTSPGGYVKVYERRAP